MPTISNSFYIFHKYEYNLHSTVQIIKQKYCIYAFKRLEKNMNNTK